MSTEPDKIYLHDPHGCFDENTEAGDNNTVTWSEDRIDENDYEYVRSAVLADVRVDVKELLHMLDESATVMFPNCGYDNRYKVLKKKISEHFS